MATFYTKIDKIENYQALRNIIDDMMKKTLTD